MLFLRCYMFVIVCHSAIFCPLPSVGQPHKLILTKFMKQRGQVKCLERRPAQREAQTDVLHASFRNSFRKVQTTCVDLSRPELQFGMRECRQCDAWTCLVSAIGFLYLLILPTSGCNAFHISTGGVLQHCCNNPHGKCPFLSCGLVGSWWALL